VVSISMCLEDNILLVFFLEGCLLLALSVILNHFPESKFWGQFLLCLACGLQNGLTSTYSKNIVRSTHITGMVNDSCMMFGYFLRNRGKMDMVDLGKFIVFIPIWVSFLTGGFVGVAVYLEIGNHAFWVPTLATFFWSFLIFLMRGCTAPEDLDWKTRTGDEAHELQSGDKGVTQLEDETGKQNVGDMSASKRADMEESYV